MTEVLTKKDIQNAMYFLITFVGAFAFLYSVLFVMNMVPESLGGRPNRITDDYLDSYWLGSSIETSSSIISQDNVIMSATTPDRIIIDRVGINTVVKKPNTRNVQVLDDYLTRGAVYYPGSGTIERGNIFVFGHSSNLPIVQNQAYRAFNGIERLVPGDSITVQADGGNYTYRVTNVELLNADEAQITFDNTKRLLTLTTCNTFGARQERWVVQAEFVN